MAEQIKLRVVGEDRLEVDIVVKRASRFATFKVAYSSLVELPTSDLKFVFDGQKLDDNDTPDTLDMDNEAMIEAYLESDSNGVWTDSALYVDSERNLEKFRERNQDDTLLVSLISNSLSS